MIKIRVRRRRGESGVEFACRKKTRKTVVRVVARILEDKKEERRLAIGSRVEFDHELQAQQAH